MILSELRVPFFSGETFAPVDTFFFRSFVRHFPRFHRDVCNAMPFIQYLHNSTMQIARCVTTMAIKKKWREERSEINTLPISHSFSGCLALPHSVLWFTFFCVSSMFISLPLSTPFLFRVDFFSVGDEAIFMFGNQNRAYLVTRNAFVILYDCVVSI